MRGTAHPHNKLWEASFFYLASPEGHVRKEHSGKDRHLLPQAAPTGLTATPGNDQVALSWSAPSSDGEAPVTGHDAHEGTCSGGGPSTRSVGGLEVDDSRASPCVTW